MTNLTKKNLIANKEYSSIGTFGDTYISIFKYENKIAVVETNPQTKTVSKKEKEEAKEFNIENLKIKSKLTGSMKVSTETGEYKTINKFENEVSVNGKSLFSIITVGNELSI